MKKLLFVCSGNTCRSPLAEGFARKIFPERLLCEIEISSAGSSAIEGLPASGSAIEIAKKNTIDLSKHRTRFLNRTIVKEADLIVTMTSAQKQTVGVIEPTALSHTFLLSEFCGGEVKDIPDPVGGDMEAYEKTFASIKKCVEAMKNLLDTFSGWKR